VFIHCAQGHGRTGLAAIALLLHRGEVSDIEEGLSLLRSIRPGIGLSADQRACLEQCLPQLRS
jgi:protein-tyrosine phosphatase